MSRTALTLILGLFTALPACASLSAQTGTVADVFARVSDAVVTIHTQGQRVMPGSQGRSVSVQGVGSGVLVGDDGRILTAAHVVQTAEAVMVEFPDGSLHEALVVNSAVASDVALIKLVRGTPTGVRPVPMGDSDALRVGDQVLVIGAPLGQSHSLSVGHMSARRQRSGVFPLSQPTEFIQTDAAINQGNSGGPMINMAGEVVGIVSHIISQSGGHEGLGYAVSGNVARSMMLDTQGFWSGIDVIYLPEPLAKAFNLPGGRPGLLVQAVAGKSPGADMGLRAGTQTARIEGVDVLIGGDVILEAMGVSVSAPDFFEAIRERLSGLQSGQELTVTVVRAGEVQELSYRWIRRG